MCLFSLKSSDIHLYCNMYWLFMLSLYLSHFDFWQRLNPLSEGKQKHSLWKQKENTNRYSSNVYEWYLIQQYVLNASNPKMLKIVLQRFSTRAPTKFVPTMPPIRPNIKMKHDAIALMFVGKIETEIAVTIVAQTLQLWKVTNVKTITWNSVRKFKATEQAAEITSQLAGIYEH